ncbi:hypothetical protein WQ57_09585 [Mesobacillus campisalis]|uniref:Uncharacterized protein n=1 Tax=Mesobacillus campisalis TaxID=1408103 RepID=A0A0M2SXJ7_9BACI|nr:hypothetical protein [Mesobacillus campisalis]KKK38426.1 hypothetical protein WQ57_09585 [Mesobacillus campisalis]
MEIVFMMTGSAIILTCFYFIVTPFFSAQAKLAEGVVEGDGRLTLDQVYDAVNELEMDYLMKKIKEKDFLQLKEQYQLLAAELMKQESIPRKQMAASKSEEAELEILRELQKLRKRKGR